MKFVLNSSDENVESSQWLLVRLPAAAAVRSGSTRASFSEGSQVKTAAGGPNRTTSGRSSSTQIAEVPPASRSWRRSLEHSGGKVVTSVRSLQNKTEKLWDFRWCQKSRPKILLILTRANGDLLTTSKQVPLTVSLLGPEQVSTCEVPLALVVMTFCPKSSHFSLPEHNSKLNSNSHILRRTF